MPFIRFFEGNGDVFQTLDSLGSDHHFNFFSPGQEEDDMKIYIRTLGDKMLTIRDVEETDKSLNSLDLNYENQLSAEALSYYPNPSDGVFTLQFKGDAEKELQVNIYDLDGKEIYREILTDFSGNYNQQIDLKDQLKGIYILQVRQDNKSLLKKIVIE